MFSLAAAFALSLAAQPATQPPVPSQSNERICRGGGQRSLGTHLRTRRRCMTAEQWQREDEARNRPAPGLQITAGQNDGRAPAQPQ